MKRELDKAIEAISYFLSGTFMLYLLMDKTFDNLTPKTRIAIEYSGKAFLVVGALLALSTIPYLSRLKWVRYIYDKIYAFSVFLLFLVGLSAVIVTGLPRYPLITVIFFYLIVIAFIFIEIGKVKKTVKNRIRSLSGVGRLLIASGVPPLWISFLGRIFEVEIPYSIAVLTVGIVFTTIGILLILVSRSQKLRGIFKRKGKPKGSK